MSENEVLTENTQTEQTTETKITAQIDNQFVLEQIVSEAGNEMTAYIIYDDMKTKEYECVLIFLHGYEDDAQTYLKMHQDGKLAIPKKSKVYFCQSPHTIFDYDLDQEVTAWHEESNPQQDPCKTQLATVFDCLAHIYVSETENLKGDNTNVFIAGVCQGAKLAFQFWLRVKKPLGGAFMFAGYLPGALVMNIDNMTYDFMNKQFFLKGKEEVSLLYQQGGKLDTYQNPTTVMKNTMYILKKMQLHKNFVNCKIVENCGHEIHQQGIKDMNDLINNYMEVKLQNADIVDLGEKEFEELEKQRDQEGQEEYQKQEEN